MFVKVPMALSSRLSLAEFAAVLACVFVGVNSGRIIEVDWTPDGVRQFNTITNSLRTELGDQLILRCGQTDYSNLFIQTEQIQFDRCNANLGLGRFTFNGFCPPGGVLILTLIQNSVNLANTVNFINNSLYYFTSYSNGQIRDVGNASLNSGGQCLDGLRMVIAIGDIPLSPPPPPPGTVMPTVLPNQVSDGTAGVATSGNNVDRHLELLYIIIPAAAGSLIIIVLAIVFSIFLIKVCYIKSKKIHHNDPLSRQRIPSALDTENQDKGHYHLVPSNDQSPSPQHSLGVVSSRTSGVQPNFYVDSMRLPSPRPSSRYNSDHESTVHVSQNEATVNQQSPADVHFITTTTATYSHELPVVTSSGRRPAPQAPKALDYQNVTESDLPPFSPVNRRDHDGKRKPVTYRPSNAWNNV